MGLELRLLSLRVTALWFLQRGEKQVDRGWVVKNQFIFPLGTHFQKVVQRSRADKRVSTAIGEVSALGMHN